MNNANIIQFIYEIKYVIIYEVFRNLSAEMECGNLNIIIHIYSIKHTLIIQDTL